MQSGSTLLLKREGQTDRERTCLYRHFDAEGALLYVGISNHLPRRLGEHTDASNWQHDICRVDVEWFDSREDAVAAETVAILKERPAHNKTLRLRRMIPDGSIPSLSEGGTITPGLSKHMWRLSRTARELLGWTQADAASAAGVSPSALKKFEAEATHSAGMISILRHTYQEAGIRFILSDEPGVEKLGVELTVTPESPAKKTPTKAVGAKKPAKR